MGKSKTTIKFYSGLDTIGAVIMEVSYNGNRCFFEAGTAFNPEFDMFDYKVSIRTNKLIKDYLWTNELPKIDYIYRDSDLIDCNLKPSKDFKYKQAFFISHLHLDHMRMMGLIDPNIDVYLSKPAQIIESALEDINMGVDSIRNMKYCDFEDDIVIGEIKVHRFILNDDSYQDYSFYIETPDLKIHYTGDIFLYGKYFENIQKEIKYINQKDIDLLISEGTTFWGNIDENIVVYPTYYPDNLLSKEQQLSKLNNIISNHNGLIVFNMYEREMSDVMELFDFETKTNRTLVFEPHQAYILNKFFNRTVNYVLPDVYNNEPYWLSDVKNTNKLINKEDIINNPKGYLVQNSYDNSLELIDYKDLNTLYLHYAGTPVGQFDPKFKTLMSILNRFNIQYITRSEFDDGTYFSSHATREQLLAYINDVKTKLIVPCHSANRKAYINNINKPKFYAELNKTYIYDSNENILKEIKDEY